MEEKKRKAKEWGGLTRRSQRGMGGLHEKASSFLRFPFK